MLNRKKSLTESIEVLLIPGTFTKSGIQRLIRIIKRWQYLLNRVLEVCADDGALLRTYFNHEDSRILVML